MDKETLAIRTIFLDTTAECGIVVVWTDGNDRVRKREGGQMWTVTAYFAGIGRIVIAQVYSREAAIIAIQNYKCFYKRKNEPVCGGFSATKV